MNILLSCAGCRNYLIDFFKTALAGHGQVFVTDSNPDAVSLQEADRGFIMPRANHPEYFDLLLDICKQNQIKLLISLNDLELPLLAKQRDLFLKIGTIPVIADPAAIDICFDKWKTFKFLTQHQIPAPKTYLSLADARQAIATGELTFPLVIKPRWGTASIGIEFPQDDEELELAYQLVKKRLSRTILADISASDRDRSVLIQEQIIGKEYGLDVINNLDGKYIATLAKRKLSMRGGETDRAVTVADPQLIDIGEKIGRNLQHIGNLDCDVFSGAQGYCILEMNPRFGGGYPFSHIAGANLPAALIAWASGKTADPDWFTVTPDLMSSKCARLVIHTLHYSTEPSLVSK
ncbi:ATP-grasp domain-containing protein [Chamaesiphon sp. VAR_48_metabat_135_sub]|uniref:ATP-grasp domain-containing protein n=1 Tax=Chamaesiphon sp. VAR_48_metabat_135_sub TaxID=2964699 RepID=UPI00286D0087|nr:ATP-grasp domain-containing protein [Chamaesiphon sp. VAR_48_metabat_135_sub]